MTLVRSRLVTFCLVVLTVLAVGLWVHASVARQDTATTVDARTTALARQIKCPVCNGESVADSAAPIAVEMRGVIRQQVVAGQSDQQILDYFRQRYGDDILLSPPKSGFDLVAWFVPVAILLASATLIYTLGRRWTAGAAGAGSALQTSTDEATVDGPRQALRRAIAAEEWQPVEGGDE